MNTSARSSTPWYRQFWPWFLIALPLVSVIFSFVTLAIALRHADVVLHDEPLAVPRAESATTGHIDRQPPP